MASQISPKATRDFLRRVWQLNPSHTTARALVLALRNVVEAARSDFVALPFATRANMRQTERDLDGLSDRVSYYETVLVDPDFANDANEGDMYPWGYAAKMVLEGGDLGTWDPETYNGVDHWPLRRDEITNAVTIVNQIKAVAGDWAEDIPGVVQRWYLQYHLMPFAQALRSGVEALDLTTREELGLTDENLAGAVQFVEARTEQQQEALDDFVEDATNFGIDLGQALLVGGLVAGGLALVTVLAIRST